ncbi:hypothetical protein NHF50_07830 [Flavobacterium sp. NRK F10]|uniref:hypothetical protein n=1 Tax=Flavobacterium sp. NRK F10 TaxID=2954931 RepID=UPI002091B25C|nr:hypothetical protein [Flavobacterium sp. NRK F10]MCO6174955.1 hypothetical protein [Flavobacterium sp. NRK F10]
MKKLSIVLLFIASFLFLTNCQNFSDKREFAQKEQAKKDSIFTSISKKWHFDFPSAKPEVNQAMTDWNQWVQFKQELQQKPKTSLLAFQMKVKNVSAKSDSLHLTVPDDFNNPQVRSRLITLDTKIKSLDTYIHLQSIPEKKVLTLISEINEEIKGVYTQMDEVVIKKAIPKEIGEEEMLRALDTTRNANFDKMQDAMQKTED